MGEKMSLRYYHPNQIITVRKHRLSVTNSGTVYHDSPSGFRKLESLWQGKIGILTVILPDGSSIKIKPTKTGLEEVKLIDQLQEKK